jgi:hypothetical protein
MVNENCNIAEEINKALRTQGLTRSNDKNAPEYIIKYKDAYANNFKTDVKSAVRFFLNDSPIGRGEEGLIYGAEGFILYPQALNPFLKIMETMGESKNIIILPALNKEENNSPAYLIIKIDGERKYIETFSIKKL